MTATSQRPARSRATASRSRSRPAIRIDRYRCLLRHRASPCIAPCLVRNSAHGQARRVRKSAQMFAARPLGKWLEIAGFPALSPIWHGACKRSCSGVRPERRDGRSHAGRASPPHPAGRADAHRRPTGAPAGARASPSTAQLYVQVLVAIAVGILLGHFYPRHRRQHEAARRRLHQAGQDDHRAR